MSVRNLTISACGVAAAFILLFLALGIYSQKSLSDYAVLSDSAARLGSGLERMDFRLEGPHPAKGLDGDIKRTDLLFAAVKKELSAEWMPAHRDPILAAGFSRASAEWKDARSRLKGGFRADEALRKRVLGLSVEVLSLSPLMKEDAVAIAGFYTKAAVIFSMVSIGAIWFAALFVILRIVTPMEEASLDLNGSLAHCMDMVNTMAEAVVETDEGGEITFINDAAEALTGRTREDLVGRDIASIMQPEAASSVREILSGATGRAVKNPEFPVVLNDGRTRCLEFSISPVMRAGKDGQAAGWCFVGRDVDDRKRLTEEVKKAKKESEEASAKLKRTIEDLEEFAHLAVRRELKMHEIRERFKKLIEERRE